MVIRFLWLYCKLSSTYVRSVRVASVYQSDCVLYVEITGLNINSEVLMRVKQEANIAGELNRDGERMMQNIFPFLIVILIYIATNYTFIPLHV